MIGRVTAALRIGCLGLMGVGAPLMLSTEVLAQRTPVQHVERSMTFRMHSNGGNCNGCEWLAADGPITATTPDDFRRFLAQNPGYRGTMLNVVLNSEGGNLVAGLELGTLIKEAGFWTSVGRTVPAPDTPHWFTTRRGICASACAYVFLAGQERFAEPGEVGFHQFYRREAIEDPTGRRFTSADIAATQVLVGVVALYLKRVEADPEILFIASSTRPNDMFFPDASEMRRLRIVTGGGSVFSGWTIEPHLGGAVVTGNMRHNARMDEQVTVFCRRSAPSQVFIMFSSTLWTPQPRPGESQADVLRSAAGPVTVRVGGRTLRETPGASGLADVRVDRSGRSYLTVSVSRDEFQAGLDSGMAISIFLPRVLNGGAGLNLPREGLRERTNIAFRACL